MSAPDELAEMKRYGMVPVTQPCDVHTVYDIRPDTNGGYVLLADADRVIAARDARIAELDEAVAVNGQMYRDEFKARRKVEAALASRDAQLAEARELLRICSERMTSYDSHGRSLYGARIQTFLSPPSQAPEARRDVGGEKL